MGSAAFLNEAVNQLPKPIWSASSRSSAAASRTTATRRTAEGARTCRPQRLRRGPQPVAVELAEIAPGSNAIYGELDDQGNPVTDAQGRPLPARAPWFGYQLFAGNSLIGARHQVYNAAALKKGAKPPGMKSRRAP